MYGAGITYDWLEVFTDPNACRNRMTGDHTAATDEIVHAVVSFGTARFVITSLVELLTRGIVMEPSYSWR